MIAPPTQPQTAAGGGAIDARTHVGPVRLTVADLDRARAFYARAIGLRTLDAGAHGAILGVAADVPLVALSADPAAPARPPRTTGLFHLALLVPDRPALARALERILAAGARLAGASDHLVSEALYLSDPEGNGIEIYRDRPRAEWRRDGGELQMATLPLDLDDLVGELRADGGDRADPGMPEGTRMGHIHLNVADLAASEAFYHGVLGFDVVVRGYPGALFVSAGGYHHHIGLNTWAGPGAPPPPPGVRGLRAFDVVLPDAAALAAVAARIRAAGIDAAPADGGAHVAAVPADGSSLSVTDPAGNRLRLVAAPQGASHT